MAAEKYENELSYNIVWGSREWSFFLLFKAHDLDTGDDRDMGNTFYLKFTLWRESEPESEDEEGYLSEMNISNPAIEEYCERAVKVLSLSAKMDPKTVNELVKFADATGASYDPRVFM